jgi:thioredoxin reductase (NADPH)
MHTLRIPSRLDILPVRDIIISMNLENGTDRLNSGSEYGGERINARNPYEVIIVGGGPAGLVAGLYCQRAALRTVLFESGLIGGQIAISKDVENYPGVEGVTGFDLAEKLLHQARSFGLSVVQREISAVSVGPGFHAVRLASGEELRTAALILAVGGTARKLGVPGEAEYLGAGVSYCATCDGFFFRKKTVVVVGGGDTAVEEALYLSRLVRKVYLVHRRGSLRAGKLLQSRLREEPGIEVVWNTVVRSINGNGRTVETITLEHTGTAEKRELPAEGVFILIGYEPNNKLIPPEVRVDELGFVITDEKCGTSVPGIFAAGDLRKKFANQIVVAAADGCVAALAAAHYVEAGKAAPSSVR